MDTASAPMPHALGLFSNQATIGTLGNPGSCTYNGEEQAYTIAGSGANIWGQQDDFHFVWRRLAGDFMLTFRGAFAGAGAEPHRKLGWMARASLEPGSPHVSATVHGDGLTALQFRRTQGGPTEELRSPINAADVVQLERIGGRYRMSVARHGDLFASEEVEGVDVLDEVYIGLFVCSHAAAVVETARFRNVRVVVPVASGFVRGRDPLSSKLEIVEIASGDRSVIYEAPEVFEAPNWTPDGAALIYNSHGLLYRFDLAQRSAVVIDTGDVTRNNNDHVLSFDGTMLGISSAEENVSVVYTVPVGGGVPKRITPHGPFLPARLVDRRPAPGLHRATGRRLRYLPHLTARRRRNAADHGPRIGRWA